MLFRNTRCIIFSLLLIFSTFTVTGCFSSDIHEHAKNEEYFVIDAKGRKVTLSHKPKRIVTLAMSLDSIVLGLVKTDNLVAVSKYLDDPIESNIPEKGVKIKNKVALPSMETLLSWKADIIFASGWTSDEMIASLSDLHIPVVVCKATTSYDDIKENISLIAKSLREEEKGEQMMDEMDRILLDIEEKVARIPTTERTKVILISLMSSYGGKGSIYDEMCNYAGVINGIADVGLKNGEVLSKEHILKANPDVIFLPSYNDHGTYDAQPLIDEYLHDPSLQTVQAIKNKRCVYPHEGYIYNASQDFVFGVQEIAYYVYGDEFKQAKNRHISFSGE